jgi:hypothetical protein
LEGGEGGLKRRRGNGVELDLGKGMFELLLLLGLVLAGCDWIEHFGGFGGLLG